MIKENYFFNTDEKTKQLIIDCLNELSNWGVPVSKSVYFRLGTGINLWGCCYLGKRTKKYSAYDYVVSINKNIVEKKDIKETIIHELLHTIDINCRHKGLWKKWADYITENSNYVIRVTASYCIGKYFKEDHCFKKMSDNQQKEYINDIVRSDNFDENKIREIIHFLTNETADYLVMHMLQCRPQYFLDYKKRVLIESFFGKVTRKTKNKIVSLFIEKKLKGFKNITYEEFFCFSGLFSLTKNYLLLINYWNVFHGI